MRNYLSGDIRKDMIKLTPILLLCFATLSCAKKSTPMAGPVSVSAIKIVPHDIPANFEFVAVAESSHIIELRARVEGYLENISYKEGSLVDEGKLLFSLDQRQFIDTLNERKGELSQKDAILWRTQQSKNRMVPLYAKNAVSQRDYDNAIADELEAAADVSIAVAALAKAEVELSYTEIKAPVTGMVGKAIFREGALISPGPDSLLANLYVINPIWVNFSISDGDLLKARRELCEKQIIFPENNNFEIEIVFSDGTVMPANGEIDFLSPSLQQNTGTMLVRSIVPNPKGWLRPGLFVKAIVKGAIRPNAILVPQEAVIMGQNGVFVFVISKEGIAEMRPVQTGDWYYDYWIISSGLEPGDIVIAKGIARVANHSRVVINDWMESLPAIKAPRKHPCE